MKIIKEEINDFDWTEEIEPYSEGEMWFKIYNVLESKFGLNLQEIVELVMGMVEEYTNLKVDTAWKFYHSRLMVEEHTNLEVE